MPMIQPESRQKHTQEIQTYQKRLELMMQQLKTLRARFSSETTRLEEEIVGYKKLEICFAELEIEVWFLLLIDGRILK